jgi:hypothetical protein
MHRNNNRSSINLSALTAAGLCLVFAATPAAAQSLGGMGGPPPDLMQLMCADRDALFAGHMTFIHTKVCIRPEQKAAWDQFVATANVALTGFDPCKEGPPPFNDPIAMRAKMDRMIEKGAELHKVMKAAADKLSAGLDGEHWYRRR